MAYQCLFDCIVGLDEIELPMYKAMLCLNKKTITHDDDSEDEDAGAQEWEPSVLEWKICEGLRGAQVTSMEFSFVNH